MLFAQRGPKPRCKIDVMTGKRREEEHIRETVRLSDRNHPIDGAVPYPFG